MTNFILVFLLFAAASFAQETPTPTVTPTPTPVETRNVFIHWNRFDSAFGYILTWNKQPDGKSQHLDVGNALSFTLPDCELGATYSVAVKSYDNEGQVGSSVSWEIFVSGR